MVHSSSAQAEERRLALRKDSKGVIGIRIPVEAATWPASRHGAETNYTKGLSARGCRWITALQTPPHNRASSELYSGCQLTLFTRIARSILLGLNLWIFLVPQLQWGILKGYTLYSIASTLTVEVLCNLNCFVVVWDEYRVVGEEYLATT